MLAPAMTRRVLVTGGCGFLGLRLATSLASQGMQVVLLDLFPPQVQLPPSVTFIAGNIATKAEVDAAFAFACAGPCIDSSSASSVAPSVPGASGSVAGIDAVFHVASYGMSGRELRDVSRIAAVNVGGTRNVLDACVRHGVPRLVYVSTCNVIFVGRPIHGGDESAPYPPASDYKDAYSATKAEAERLVLAANGTPLQSCGREGRAGGGQKARRKEGTSCSQAAQGDRGHAEREPQEGLDGGEHAAQAGRSGQQQNERQGEQERPQPRVLHTCAVRSTGIWGAGETRHQPRVIRMVRAGLFMSTFGDPGSLSDWIHVDNLVQLLLLAERALRAPASDSGPCEGTPRSGDAGGGADSASGGRGSGSASADASGRAAPSPIAAGQVYYASDGAPINNFHHFKPVIVGLGYHYPSLNVPFALVYGIAALIEYGWPLLQYIVTDPPLTRMEVDKCAVTHWFDISKARRELGYEPVAYDRQEVVDQMRAAGWAAGMRGRKEGEARGQEGAAWWGVEVMGVRMGVGVLVALAVLLVAVLVALYGLRENAVRQQHV